MKKCGSAYGNQTLDGADDDTAKTELEGAANNLFFTDEANAGHHLLKHFHELYGDLHKDDLASQADHYSTQARAAVSSNDDWSTSQGQTGSTSHKFKKGGLAAFVPVKGPNAVLASFDKPPS